MIDNATLLIGIAFSSASLMIALVIGWLHSRSETYLVHGAAGIALVVVALLALGLRNGSYDLIQQLLPFAILLAGFSFIYSGTRIFRDRAASVLPPVVLGGLSIALTAAPLIAGYSGLGTIMLNACSAVLMALSGWEYWRGRTDARAALTANAVLFGLTALSFFACAAILAVEGQWVLDGPPDNWAEDANSIMSLVGLTGIGAITLTLHHTRAARRHRLEANTDALTGALNRRALFGLFPEEQLVPGLAVLMLDLDNFKQINDRLGHAQGDLVLQRFADVLRATLRQHDVIARLGGEEFCVILPGLDRDKAGAVAERIRTAFARLAIPIDPDGKGVATVSAGLATGGVNENFSSVLRRADDALYNAKRGGRNQVQIAPFQRVA